MLEQQGRVVALAQAGQVWVALARQSGCDACSNAKQCGGGADILKTSGQHVVLADANGRILTVGDSVIVTIEEALVWRGLLLLYLWPLAALALASMAGQQLAGDAGAGAGAVIGLALALLVSRIISRKQDYRPRVLDKLSVNVLP